jgi:hypothetical protein
MSDPKRVARLVPVHFLQADMEGYEDALPYPVPRNLRGQTYFTENVIFGEVWISERTSRKTRWSGHILNGQLYLDEAIRRKGVVSTRPATSGIPSLLPVGKYKIWLDAWCRIKDFSFAYDKDAPFTKDNTYSNSPDDLWRAPERLPDRKYWQEIEVKPTSVYGDPCKIYVRSRRFHYIYRISRLMDMLDSLLIPHENIVSRVANVRELADHLMNFFAAERNSGNNELHFLRDNVNELAWINISIQNVSIACQNFINAGVAGDAKKGVGGEGSVTELRQHLNNFAALLWRIIDYTPFQKDTAFYEPSFAEEHRIILSRLGSFFNRMPVACSGGRAILYHPDEVLATNVSPPWGKKFAEEFSLPFYNVKAQKAGHAPPFKFKKSGTPIDWINSVRRYGVSMLNSASIWVVESEIDIQKMGALLDAQFYLNAEYHLVENTASLLMPDLNKFIQLYERLGKTAKITKWKGVREALLQERRALSKEGFRVMINPDLDAELNDLEQQIAKVQEDLKAVQKREPQKLLDSLKGSNPKAVYAVEGFEVAVKWLVAKAAWNAFAESAGQPPEESIKKAVDATFKTLDFTGTLFKSAGFAKLLEVGWKDATVAGIGAKDAGKIFGKWGKGLGAVADVYSAASYTYEIFYDKSYERKLFETYLPSDAVAIHGWHLVIWMGKSIVGLGSTGSFFSKSPGFVKLQAVGYLFQAIGEFGEAWTTYGKAEKAHYVKVLFEMRNWANIAQACAKNNGYEIDLYPDATNDKVKESVEALMWGPMDETEYRKIFGLAMI